MLTKSQKNGNNHKKWVNFSKHPFKRATSLHCYGRKVSISHCSWEQVCLNFTQEWQTNVVTIIALITCQCHSVKLRVQSESSFLPPPKESPRHGGLLALCFISSPHVWDSVFWGGGKKDDSPYTYTLYIYMCNLSLVVNLDYWWKEALCKSTENSLH